MADEQGEPLVEEPVADLALQPPESPEGGPAEQKLENGRIHWPLRSDKETHELQGPMKNAIMYSGIKDVQRLLQNGAPLIADYPLESEGGAIGTGTTLDLVLLHKRFKLATQLLRQGIGTAKVTPAAQMAATTEASPSQEEAAQAPAPEVAAGTAQAEASKDEAPGPAAQPEESAEAPDPNSGQPVSSSSDGLALQPAQAEVPQEGVELAKASRFGVAWSSRDGRIELLEALLSLGALPSQQDEHGRPALLLAAMRGQKRCVDVLIAAGAWHQESPEMQLQIGEWLTHFKMAFPELSGVVKPYDHETPHALAALRLGPIHKPEVPDAPEIPQERWTNTPHGRMAWPLRPAARDEPLEGPLERAILGHGIKEVERVIALGAPLTGEYRLDEQGNDLGNALDLAMVSRRYNLAMQLLSRCEESSVLAQSSTCAVVWAAREGRANILRELLRLGAAPGQCDEAGRSALLLATTRGRADCAEALLEGGAWQLEAAPDEVAEWATTWKMKCFFAPE